MRVPVFKFVLGIAGVIAVSPVAPLAARADFVVLPPNRTLANIILYDRALTGMRNMVEQVTRIYENKAGAGIHIQAAREAFWSNVANPDGYEDRYRTYLQALLAKDIHYLGAYAALGPEADESVIAAQFGGDIDGGIPMEASPSFNAWVRAVRYELGATEGMMLSLTTSSSDLLGALETPEVVKAYGAYQVQRDSVEFTNAGYGAFFQERLAELSKDTPVLFTDGPDRVSGPMVIRRKYESAPELYAPIIDPAVFTGEAQYLIADLPARQMADTLYRYQIGPLDFAAALYGANVEGAFFSGPASFEARSAAMQDPRRQQLGAYMQKFAQQPKVLECEYEGYRTIVMWFDPVPDFADLPSGLAPILAITDQGNQCPAVWPKS